jgi:tight adherence protein C
MMLLLLATIAGGLFGSGMLMIVRGVTGNAATVADFVAELNRPRHTSATAEGTAFDRMLAATVQGGIDKHRSNLDICERSATKFATDRLLWAMIFAMPGFLALMATISGVDAVPASLALLSTIGLAVGGWFYALADLRSDAMKKRREFRHALAAYLELVTILMSGGAGVQSAIYDAAAIGRGSAFRHMKSALSQAQARRETPWATLGALGVRLDLAELVELEQAMTLAADGSRVRESLRAKAEAMRDRDRAEKESEAERRSESMVLPVAMMFAGFLLLLGYPAVQALSGPA